MQNYVDAKMRILQNQTEDDAFVYWQDDPIISQELKKYGVKSHLCPFSEIKKNGTIGYLEDGQFEIEYPVQINMEQESLALQGKHNLYNSLAAGISANLVGVKGNIICQCLHDFKGVEHRLEKVATVDDVLYINDSKATNVDACYYALESVKTPVVLILGGKDKGNDYNEIKDLVREKCRAIVFLGADNSKLHNFFDGMGITISDTHSMPDCVAECHRLAQPGDTVLLSPCCASFDLFNNMAERGRMFKDLVHQLEKR
jgi:UDP-N-acetylmuramoylalanine--D-glutamate ligase